MKSLKNMLKENYYLKTITLFYDIETFQYNEKKGKVRPSQYKNMTYSVAVSWIEEQDIFTEIFPNFKEFFDTIIRVYGFMKKKPKIILNAHNTNKYDNHFMRKDLLYYYPMKVENYFLTTATTEKSNEDSKRLKDLTKQDKQGIILEKRIKSKINMELIFFLKGIQFETEDNWIKTNSSIDLLGKKLKRLGKLTDDELKTDFDYLKYNRAEDLTEEEAREYALQIFKNLSEKELQYIRNDVIILAKTVLYYTDLFHGFDYSKMTFTSNILDSYNDNDLTSFQLLNRIGTGKEKIEVRYTDYTFSGMNFYDYLKPFYRGGLNFYNQFLIGKIIDTGVFSMDINSSYPYAMHHFKIPTYLEKFESFDIETEVQINDSDDFYTLFQLSKKTFDEKILQKIDSIILKQILVKYYSTNETINLNTYTFKMIENVTGIRFEKIPVFSYVTFSTAYFGSRRKIEEFYKIKTQGGSRKKLLFSSLYDIQETEEDNTVIYSSEEIAHSKVNLNGLYGIPALRPYFNLFRRNEKGEYFNIENGHKNAERNIVFSIFVTSVALWNLLNPLSYLTQKEIDENFIYCDTDSLYFKQAVKKKLPPHLFDSHHLGMWDLEHDKLEYFYVLNHKKYVFQENGKIQVRSGGVPLDSFRYDMDFETFIKKQFSNGVEIKALKSIYNEQETISIYPSTIKLEIGGGYRIRTDSDYYDTLKERIFKSVKENIDDFDDDVLYIESEIGTFSLADVTPFENTVKEKEDLIFLQIKQDKIKKIIETVS